MQINLNNTEEMIKGTYSATKAYKSYENYNRDYSVHGFDAGGYGKNNTVGGTGDVSATTEVTFGGKKLESANASDVYSNKKEMADKGKSEQENKAVQMAQAVNNLKEMITPEGYNALSELGIIPDEENPEMVIGVCERIQMQLAAYCEDYKPVGLNIDKAKMAEVLGSEAFAKSVEKAMDISYINDDSKAAIINGAEKLTIDEVYKHAHSVSVSENNSENVVSLEVWNNLKPQIEKLFDKMGVEANAENLETAKWMLSYNVPLTEENIHKTIKINEMTSLPKDEIIRIAKENISLSMYFTGNASSALFTKDQYSIEKVADVLDVLDKATDEHVEAVLTEGKILNIANLKIVMKSDKITMESSKIATESGMTRVQEEARAFAAAVTTKSVIVTARAILTSTSLLKMQQVGIDVNMTSLTEMISIESKYNENVANEYLSETSEETIDTAREIFTNTLNATGYIRNASISMVASVSVELTLNTVGKMAAKAIATYDTLGTSVRRDMGDSYSKAFTNVDELLDAVGMDKNTSTRRAVRILGYNSMEITEENILRVESVASELDFLVNNLTPKTASYLIANDINPLEMKIKDLNEELKRINEELDITENEDYAKYLWQLDKAGAISKEDRDKYISIYRTIKALTKKDSRAIGAAILCDYELTMDNILKAEKNRRYSGEMDMSDKDMDYMKYLTSRIKDMETVTEAEVTELINHNVDVNIKNIKKLKELKEGNKAFVNLYETGGKGIKDIIDSLNEEFDKNFESEETLQDTVEEINKAAVIELEEARNSELPTYNNINAALDNFGLTNLMSAYSKDASYYVPMEIGGEITGIHLTIRHSKTISKVNTYIKESVYGKISLEVSVSQNKISGMLVYEDASKKEEINKLLEQYIEELEKAFGLDKDIENIDIKSINSVDSMYFEVSEEMTEEEGSGNDSSREKLFTSAKLFIATIRTYEF